MSEIPVVRFSVSQYVISDCWPLRKNTEKKEEVIIRALLVQGAKQCYEKLRKTCQTIRISIYALERFG